MASSFALQVPSLPPALCSLTPHGDVALSLLQQAPLAPTAQQAAAQDGQAPQGPDAVPVLLPAARAAGPPSPQRPVPAPLAPAVGCQQFTYTPISLRSAGEPCRGTLLGGGDKGIKGSNR